MRILAIANLPPYVLGGAENQVARLVEAWTSFGHHVEVAGHRIPDGMLQLGPARIRTHRIAAVDGFGRVGRAVSYFFSIARLMRRVRGGFDVIYCRGLGDGAISICLLKAIQQIRLPLVVCPINARGAGDANFVRSIPGWRQIVQIVNQQCNALNIIAPGIEGDLIQLGITRPRLGHIPNGIPLAPTVQRRAAGLPRRLIWTGRLTHQKGLDLLLDVLAVEAEREREFRLEIIGEGPEMQALTVKCQQLGLSRCVRFVGALDREAVRDRLAVADVFLLPSRYEGMSNSALEAMEAGLPLVLTRCGGIDAHIDSGIGWFCEPNNAVSLSSAMRSMLKTPSAELLAMGCRARALVERAFEIGEIARSNADLLAEVVAGARKIRQGSEHARMGS